MHNFVISQGLLTFYLQQSIMPKNVPGCVMQQEFITVEDIARNLGVSDDLVRKWIREKKLPAYQVGKEYRIKQTDYERFLEKRRTMEPDTDDGI